MNALQSRKRLLIAESELNRAELAEDLVALRTGVCTLTDRAKSLTSFASTAAALLAGLAAFRRRRGAATGAKRSWLRTILNIAGLISSIGLAVFPPHHDQDRV